MNLTEEQVAQALLNAIAKACDALRCDDAARLTEAYVKLTRRALDVYCWQPKSEAAKAAKAAKAAEAAEAAEAA